MLILYIRRNILQWTREESLKKAWRKLESLKKAWRKLESLKRLHDERERREKGERERREKGEHHSPKFNLLTTEDRASLNRQKRNLEQ